MVQNILAYCLEIYYLVSMMKQDFRSLSPSAQEAIRIRAVKAVLNGATQVSIAAMFNVSTEAVRQWMRRHEQGGFAALKARQRGRRKRIQLEPLQAALVVRTVKGRCPDQVKLPWVLWTRDAVARFIEDKFDICLSRWTVGRYLKRWGFTPQKPAKRALEQNPKAVQHWLETEYPAIKAEAKEDDAEIQWGDESGIRSDHQTGTTWAPKGKTPIVKVTGNRFGCNMISTITNRGTLRFMVFTQRFTADVFIIFLDRLIRSVQHKVYLIIDRHPVHKARKVKRWLDKHTERICVFYLPSYSPELNPDEYLNNDVKSNSVGRRRASSKADLLRNVRSHLHRIQKLPSVVKKYFHEEHVRYAM